jgi:hypothetical protein
MLGIEPRLAFINGVLLANRVLIFRFQLLAVYVLLVHNCGECRIGLKSYNGYDCHSKERAGQHNDLTGGAVNMAFISIIFSPIDGVFWDNR